MIEPLGHLLGPLLIFVREQIGYFPPLYFEPRGNHTRNLVTIGCFAAPSFCHVITVVSVTPLGFEGVPAFVDETVGVRCTDGHVVAATAAAAANKTTRPVPPTASLRMGPPLP